MSDSIIETPSDNTIKNTPSIITYAGCAKRATKTVYRQYGVNRLELEILCSLVNSLQWRRVSALGLERILRDYLTNVHHNASEKAALYNLHTLGMIEKHFQGIKGYNYSITPLGRTVLSYYEECMQTEVNKVIGNDTHSG